MPAKVATKKVRGLPVSLPLWWLKEANRMTEGLNLAEVATRVSKASHRPTAWDRTTVSNFLKGQHATYELMLAFCEVFEELLQPVFIADSYQEAHQLLLTIRRVRGSDVNPEKDARRAVLVKAREQVERRVADQTEPVDSMDEGIASRRRPRGLVRSRTPSS